METAPLKLSQFSKGGGCGCKIAPAVLQQIVHTDAVTSFPELLVGNESNDDAAAYRIEGDTAIISTTDFFLPIVDDPYDFGRIAAANAISDVYAMGGSPLMAIAILGWPIEKLPVEVAREVLRGGRAVCAEAGIPLAGGHTIDSSEPIFGLAVTGSVKVHHLKRNDGAQEGDVLYLTKPLGVGVLATALKRGVLEEAHYEGLMAQMTRLNKVGAQLGLIAGVHALTDVTGFGLLGHLHELCAGSGLSAELQYGALPRIGGLETYLQQRTIPDATFRNWNSYGKEVSFGKGVNVMEAFNLLPDPQTNGGLLVAVAPADTATVETLLRAEGLYASPIGTMKAAGEKRIEVML
ncbi:selenide, water dikinase SelD [Flaviaesturariibacter amylovorans]|uniref:Selenide, water dikinase n=1 Tax=Flaviaesturariibacter amylovorans TaxID=1084520 RepID=A0ABP8HDR6_9BACT